MNVSNIRHQRRGSKDTKAAEAWAAEAQASDARAARGSHQ